MVALVFVPTTEAAPPPADDTRFVVVDAAWTPTPGARADVVPIRPAISAVIERVDLFAEALRRLDAWADEADLPGRLIVDDVPWWDRLREPTWNWLHERLLWRMVIAELARGEPITRIDVPAEATALAEVADAIHPTTAPRAASAFSLATDGAGPATSTASLGGRVRRSLIRALGRGPRRPGDPRAVVLDDRIAAMRAGTAPRILVLSLTGLYQPIGDPGASRQDPNLATVIGELERRDATTVVFGFGLDHRSDEDWPMIAADPRLLPQSLLGTRWRASDPAPDATAGSFRDRFAATPLPALLADGVDLAPAATAEILRLIESVVLPGITQTRRIERLIDEVRPTAIVMTHEGIRTPWLVAAARRGVPTFAVQHGIIHPGHPGYTDPRGRGTVHPTRTFVRGPSDRRVLIESGGYRSDEVEVVGAPRHDLADDAGDGRPAPASVRAAVRDELGVGDADRMLVVSTNFQELGQLHLLHALELTLGGPLPGIHVVFKQHPGETGDGPYHRLLEGLARAGGYAAPPMITVRDVDLYRLLAAADAHLGLHSTVLTDAVVVGTPNLIAMTEARADLLGYVAAGVAVPVREVADVRAALEDPRSPDPGRRQAFLEDLDRPGPAGARIAASILALGAAPTAAAAR